MTLDEKRRKGTITYNRLVTVAAAFGSLTYGYCASVIGSTIGQPGWYQFFDLPLQGEPGYGGSLFIMWSATALGRKRNIQIGALLSVLGGALQSGAQNLEMFQAGRFISGLGIGVLVTICPMYLSELAPPAKREWLVGHHAIFLVFGYMLSSWLVLKLKSYRKRMIVGFLTQWGAEFGGPLVINNYLVILFTNLGQTGAMPLILSAVWLTIAGVIYNPLGAWLHDKVNSRRGIFMTGFAGIVLTVSLLVIMLDLYSATTNKAGNTAGVFLVFLYLAFQGTFCDTTMYIYVAEIFPTEIRPIGMGFSLFGQFASSIILLQTAPIGFVQVGWKYYLVIIIWSALFIPVIYFYFLETAGLSLEEINQKFGDDVAVHINDVSEEQRRELDDMSSICPFDANSSSSASSYLKISIPTHITGHAPPPDYPPLHLTGLSKLRWAVKHPPSDPTVIFTGKTVFVTGANTGLGFEAALKYTSKGCAKLILGVRSLEKGTLAKQQILQQSQRQHEPDFIKVLTVDLAGFASVQTFATHPAEECKDTGLDIALFKAGLANPAYTASPTGYEMAMQLNVLSTALMAWLIMPILTSTASRTTSQDREGEAGAKPHLTFVNSIAHTEVQKAWYTQPPLNSSLLAFANSPALFEQRKKYAAVKLLGMSIMWHFALTAPEVVVNSCCPFFCRTELGRNFAAPVKLLFGAAQYFTARTAE
ncbi:MFS general substrate transporter [Setomelanomma holmii]|uniref:MFS general substrate transporter n=1 Tax=Setomelanomma holmii TaxID=210430 RepID=A0A9P4GXZ8_9PLEO|nr:MFS general substrate transporter [Setomelanomma holmii]